MIEVIEVPDSARVGALEVVTTALEAGRIVSGIVADCFRRHPAATTGAFLGPIAILTALKFSKN